MKYVFIKINKQIKIRTETYMHRYTYTYYIVRYDT